MSVLTTMKRFVKSNGLLYAHAAALRSRRPAVNVARLRRNLLFAKVMTRTLVSYDRLLNTCELAEQLERDGRDGAFVECGVWRGGVAALMALVARKAGGGRKTHLFDSFEGLPRPTVQDAEDFKTWGGDEVASTGDAALEPIGVYAASLEDVSTFLFEQLHLDRTQVLLHKGWFQHTLPAARPEVGPIALLRIDADWYSSVKECLDTLYDNVIDGGYVILDDFGEYPGCRQAFEEFRQARGLNPDLHAIDQTGVWFQKPWSRLRTSLQGSDA